MAKTISDRVKNAMIRASTLAWMKERGIKNEKNKRIRVDEKSNFYFLKEIYQAFDEEDDVTVQKPSQSGVSTTAIMTEIHASRYWGINQIHTLPTVSDVGKFVPSKVNEIIKNNPTIRKGMSNKEVDAITQKQFGKGYLYFKGTHSERESIMLTSDQNTYDELDKSNQEEIKNYESRMEGAESMKRRRFISTPTVPNFGINKKFLEGDQRYWRFPCKHCKHRQHMEWPKNVDIDKGIYICKKCGKEITHDMMRPYNGGRWEARFPKHETRSYSITQMIAPWVKPKDLIKAYKQAEKDGELDYFYNHKLGEPYVALGSQIQKTLILRNLTQKEIAEVNCIGGADVQLHELYVMIGTEEGVFAIIVVRDTDEYIDSEGKEGKSKWDRMAELMDVYDIRYFVIDGGYTPNEVIAFAKRFPGRVWVNWYKDDPKKAKIIRWQDEDFNGKQQEFEEEIKVLTERDRMIDWTLEDLRTGRIRFINYKPEDEAIKKLIKHMEVVYKRTVTDKLGDTSSEWVSSGKDDFLHALNYYKIARERKIMTEK